MLDTCSLYVEGVLGQDAEPRLAPEGEAIVVNVCV